MHKIAAVVLLCTGLIGCQSLGITNWSPSNSWAIGCEAYASTLKSLAAFKQIGKLSAADIATINQWEPLITPICMAPAPPTAASALTSLEQGVTALLTVQKAHS